MPYKDPERKKQWEREHREERNARRRKEHLSTPSRAMAAKPTPGPSPHQEPQSAWKAIAALVVGLGVVLLAALAGVPVSGNLGSRLTRGNRLQQERLIACRIRSVHPQFWILCGAAPQFRVPLFDIEQ